MQDTALHWNPKKCNVILIRRVKQVVNAADLEAGRDHFGREAQQWIQLQVLGCEGIHDARRQVSTCSCGKDVLQKALSNLDEPSVRRQPYTFCVPMFLTSEYQFEELTNCIAAFPFLPRV